MNVFDLSFESKLDQIRILHELTKGWDKFLVLELLNRYYRDIHTDLGMNQSPCEKESKTIDIKKFHFRQFVHESGELKVTNSHQYYSVPDDELYIPLSFYEPLEILENSLKDSLSEDDYAKLY